MPPVRRERDEALVNALTHRDYAKLGQIYVRVRDNELTISSPGGFMQGVTLENLLRVEPIPRNPRLADAFKRLGLWKAGWCRPTAPARGAPTP